VRKVIDGSEKASGFNRQSFTTSESIVWGGSKDVSTLQCKCLQKGRHDDITEARCPFSGVV
jgi:hypothetical protein